MKKVGLSAIAVGLLLIVGCTGSSEEETNASEAEVVERSRSTLDGFWRQEFTTGRVGITFNKCLSLDGSSEVNIGGVKRACAASTPDVGSYLIYGTEGAVLESGTYAIRSLPASPRPGIIDMFMKDATKSYVLEYRIRTSSGNPSTLEIASKGGGDLVTYKARMTHVPSSCTSGNRVDSKPFFTDEFDFNWLTHDYTGGGMSDGPGYQNIYAKRPFRFGYPACDVHHQDGFTESDVYNMVCDGVFETKINEDRIVFEETAQTFPRFYSLYEAITQGGGPGIGKALSPLVDLQGENIPGCEQKVEAKRLGDVEIQKKKYSDALAAHDSSRARKARDALRDLTTMTRENKAAVYGDNACKLLLSQGGQLLPQAAGQPLVRWVQVFQGAVFVSNGSADSDQCVVQP